MVEVVQKLQAVVAHGIRFLGDRAGDHAVRNPVQRLRILVKGHDCDLAFLTQPVQGFRRAGASGGLEAQDAVDFFLLIEKG